MGSFTHRFHSMRVREFYLPIKKDEAEYVSVKAGSDCLWMLSATFLTILIRFTNN